MVSNFRKILCPIDFSERSDAALRYAFELARLRNAHVLALHVIDLSSASMYGEFLLDPQEIQAQLENYAVEHVGRMLGDEELSWEPLIALGHPADEAARVAAEQKVDLAIAATHGRSGLQRLLLGSVTERMMRTLPCPLLVIPGAMGDALPPTGFRRIAVGCDFSPDSDLAVTYAFDLARYSRADIHLVHVMEMDRFSEMFSQDKRSDAGSMAALRDKLTDDLAGLIPPGAHRECEPKLTLLAGQPHEELTKFAVMNEVDLIVLGIHGRGFVEMLLVGSTTDRVVRTAPCPVLSVRPPAHGLK